MLFDLQGKRRRVVQVMYLGLAILMGGGLVFFGIGGDVSGGLFDAFSERRWRWRQRQQRHREAHRPQRGARQRQPAQRGRPPRALVRDYYQLATVQTSDQDTSFPARRATSCARRLSNWQAYLALEPERVDSSLARVALQIFDPAALNRPKAAQEAARVIAESENDTRRLPGAGPYATLAGDTRTADLAGQKAVDLAPKAERKEVEAQVKQLKTPPQAQGAPRAPPPSPSAALQFRRREAERHREQEKRELPHQGRGDRRPRRT